jgi:succinyl-diaminopimelate desuccinylase
MDLHNTANKIIDLTGKLIATPSYRTEKYMADLVYKTLTELGFHPEIIASDLDHPSVFCMIHKPNTKKTVWLESSMDTVEAGNIMNWKTNPLEPVQKNGRLYGLGAGDSKYAVAQYIYLAKSLYDNPEFNSSIFLGFDASEQSGKFSGIRDIIEYVPECDLCLLGGQDFDTINIGARGWLRIKLYAEGVAAHSGRSKIHGVNAIHKLVKLINAILDLKLDGYKDDFFEFGAKLNVTQISGGEYINIVPDRAECFIDIRLTPQIGPEDMIALIGNTLRNCQLLDTDIRYNFNVSQTEPAFVSDPNDPFIQILLKNAKEILNPNITLAVSGPGSVGNLISQRFGIPIINAFGVHTENPHAPDEFIEMAHVEPVIKTLEKSLVEWSKL